MPDTPDQVHGSLLEAVHISGYAFERAWQKLEWLLEDGRWQRVGAGYADVNDFLATIKLPEGVTPDRRKKVAARIKALQPEASQRKIAGALGVGEQTVARDLGKPRRSAPVGAPDNPKSNNGAVQQAGRAPTGAPTEPKDNEGAEIAREAEKRRRAEVTREARRAEKLAQLDDIEAREAKAVEGVYDVVVIDPPWPMEKIERDERPRQVEFDYPVKSEHEIGEIVENEAPFADDCHVWLWTTQRFLPMAFRLLERWALKYVCTFVWRKPGGFQPVGLPQYNAEFALYARRGSPLFVETRDLPVCFEAPRGNHSEKPDRFYEIVRRVTAGRRLDMFSRREIRGFDGWGNESA